MIERLKAALAKTGKPARAVSIEAGMSPAAIRGVVNNPESSPTVETVRKLATALEVTPEWLAFGVGETSLHDFGSEYIPIRGEVSAGTWLQVDQIVEPEEYERAPIAYTPEWPRAAQYGLRVKGTSINRRAADGDILRCIDVERSEIRAVQGDLVIAQLSRDHGSLIQVTAKVLKIEGAFTRLEPDSTDTRHVALVFDDNNRCDGVEMRIIAVVDMAMRPFKRGG